MHSSVCLFKNERIAKNMKPLFLSLGETIVFKSHEFAVMRSSSLEELKNFCLWITSTGQLLGTVFYYLTSSRKISIAVLGENQSQKALFIAPNGEIISFDATALLDKQWHFMCFVSDYFENNSCQLFIDGFRVAATSNNKNCSLSEENDLHGMFVLGSGIAFDSTVNEAPVNKLNGLSDHINSLFHIGFNGRISNWQSDSSTLTKENIVELMFRCNIQNKGFRLLSSVTVLKNTDACKEVSECSFHNVQSFMLCNN